jgi:hypothetical protein
MMIDWWLPKYWGKKYASAEKWDLNATAEIVWTAGAFFWPAWCC